MKENIKIKIELFSPVIIETKYEELVYDKFLKMLEDILQSSITIEIDGKMHEIMASFQTEKGKSFRYYSTLVLKFVVDIEELYAEYEAYSSNKEKLSEEQKKALQRSCVMSEIEKYIMDFTFAMNLAYPGFFEFDKARILVNNKEYKRSRIDRTLVDWIDSYIKFQKNNWPVIHLLKFEQVWQWLKCRTNFMDGISKTAIDRALNALTYTMGDSSYEEIFYVLMGIEAIYNDNDSNGIAEQIRVKTEALLKRPEIFRKRISKFYDNRSKFIHGKLNFPNKYCPYDATDEFEDFFFNKYLQTVEDARAILISTIQEYIIQDASKMKVDVVTTLGN